MPSGRRAVFLDRDGVITEPAYNPVTGEYESPHRLEDLALCPGVESSLHQLQERGFELFIVSNQPSYAKGKVALATLRQIAATVEARLAGAGVSLRDTYYCYHHPAGVVAEYSGPCRCRKPSPYFLQLAAEQYGLELASSWMVGDRDSDVECGQRAGCRTILVAHQHAGTHQGASRPVSSAADLAEAVALIMDDAGHAVPV